MRNIVIITVLFLTAAAFAQRTDSIRGTRVGGVRPGTVQRAKQNTDPEVRKEIAATSKDTGIKRETLLSEFRDTQQKFAQKIGQQGNVKMSIAANSSAASGTTPAFSARDFHRAKVFSMQNTSVSMDTIIDRTAKLGNLDNALAELKPNPK